MIYPALYLRSGHDVRLRQGHLWIYSNEVDVQRSPLKSFSPGDLVSFVSSRGEFIGIGYINPSCLLCGRLLTRRDQFINEDFFEKALQVALSFRRHFYAQPYYRCVFGEGDGLPGLVIDRYGSVCVVQLNTAGMDRLWPVILPALKKILEPRCVVLRNDGAHRLLEGLSQWVSVVEGNADRLEVFENGCHFNIPLIEGQKTGWFYDHRDNRSRLLPWVKGCSVLDVFSYVGSFGVPLAKALAERVCCVDSSASAIAALKENAHLNQVADRMDTICGDAFEVLASLVEQNKKFDFVIIDPPAFIKSIKDQSAGMRAYVKINRLALQLLAPQGVLLTASCSMHLSMTDLWQVIKEASMKTRIGVFIIGQWGQPFDHPSHPNIPETAYLKSFLCRKNETL